MLLPAQEPSQPCDTGLANSELTSRACDRNENASGVDVGLGTPNRPILAPNSGDGGWVHAWLRKVDQVRAPAPFCFASVQLTSCWFNNSATTCPGSKIPPVARRLLITARQKALRLFLKPIRSRHLSAQLFGASIFHDRWIGDLRSR